VVTDYLWLLIEQAQIEFNNRRDQGEIERCRRVLAGVVPPSQEDDKGSERKCDHDRLLKKLEDKEELIRLRQSTREAVEGQLSALSAIQIDSYLAVAGVPAHDPLRLALNGQGISVSKATESPSETSMAQNCKTFAAETFIDLTGKYGRKGVPAEALRPFADQCDAREYKIDSYFLRDRVLKAIDKYNTAFPKAQIETYSDLVETLCQVPVSASSVKKRQKNSRQEVAREFRVWLYEMKRDYLKKLKKRSK
jgi:hypothetical protein